MIKDEPIPGVLSLRNLDATMQHQLTNGYQRRNMQARTNPNNLTMITTVYAIRCVQHERRGRLEPVQGKIGHEELNIKKIKKRIGSKTIVKGRTQASKKIITIMVGALYECTHDEALHQREGNNTDLVPSLGHSSDSSITQAQATREHKVAQTSQPIEASNPMPPNTKSKIQI